MKKQVDIPKFRGESEEADWWASRAGRDYVKLRSTEVQSRDAQTKRTKPAGSRLVRQLAQKNSVQIAIRIPEGDLAQARKIATRKGIGYQTLIKMLLHEGLHREAKRD
jgi:predicted DNA binding CopG/RHH family protein